MALKKYVLQLRPIQENKVDYVERVQSSLSELTIFLIKISKRFSISEISNFLYLECSFSIICDLSISSILFFENRP